jgi:hypothetical protein
MLLSKIKAPESGSTMLDVVPEPKQLSRPKPEHVYRLAYHRRKAADGALASTWTTKDELLSDKEPGSAAQSIAVDSKSLRERRAIVAGLAANVSRRARSSRNRPKLISPSTIGLIPIENN